MTDLPEFDTPPVVEVALGVQFRILPALRGLALAPLRELWRSQYPRVEEQPPLPSSVGSGSPGGPIVQLNVGLPSMRYWFLSSDGSDLVQVQQDRLSVNWREAETGNPYPRYRSVRKAFEDRFRELQTFVEREHLGTVRVMQAELEYVNSVSVDPGRTGQIGQVLDDWHVASHHHLGEPEEARVQMSFRVGDLGDGESRLWVQVVPGQRKASEAAVLLTLSARGKPTGEGLDETLAFLDGAHNHIVLSFTELTTSAKHEVWRRRQ